jgi:hypothetical protein
VKYVSDLWRILPDGGAAIQLTRGEHDTAPCFRADGALEFFPTGAATARR